jgi:hypothetical protein
MLCIQLLKPHRVIAERNVAPLVWFCKENAADSLKLLVDSPVRTRLGSLRKIESVFCMPGTIWHRLDPSQMTKVVKSWILSPRGNGIASIYDSGFLAKLSTQ